jgi:hypothetical protein
MEPSPSWEAANCAGAQELHSILWNPRFVTVFARALHWSLASSRSVQSIPSYPVSLRSILILFTHLRLGLPTGLFPSDFATNILYAFIFSPIHAIFHAHLILFLTWGLTGILNFKMYKCVSGSRGSVVGWGTMPQTGKSRVRIPRRSLDFFNLPNPSSRTMTLGSTQPLIEMSTRNLPGGKGRLAPKADNLTAICEPIV